MSRFANQVFLISGGARGMGAAQARALAAEGGHVIIGDVLADAGRKVAADIGAACTFVPLDVTSEAQWAAKNGLFSNSGTSDGSRRSVVTIAPYIASRSPLRACSAAR